MSHVVVQVLSDWSNLPTTLPSNHFMQKCLTSLPIQEVDIHAVVRILIKVVARKAFDAADVSTSMGREFEMISDSCNVRWDVCDDTANLILRSSTQSKSKHNDCLNTCDAKCAVIQTQPADHMQYGEEQINRINESMFTIDRGDVVFRWRTRD